MTKQNNCDFYCNKHSCFLLQYHLVLVTKYRHKVLVGDLESFLYAYFRCYFTEHGLHLMEVNGEADHVHLLFEAYPQMNLAEFINALKSASSRKVKAAYSGFLKRYYWKPYFGSKSYFLCTVSDRSVEVVKQYIQHQKGL